MVILKHLTYSKLPPILLISILFLGLFIRLSVLLVLTSGRIPQLEMVASGRDAIGYVQLAMNIIEENVFAFADGNPTAYRMPGYPLFLAFLFRISGNWFIIRISQILLDITSIFLVYQTAKKVTYHHYALVLAPLLVALNPFVIISSVSLLPETLTFCLMALVIFLLISYPHAAWPNWAIPVILGVIIYLKPTLFLVAIVFSIEYAIYKYLKSHYLRYALSSIFLSLTIFAVMLLPWAIRNYNMFQGFIPLTTSAGSNLYGGNNPDADGGYVLSGPYVINGMNELESDKFYKEQAKMWIRSNLKQFIMLLPAKAVRFFWPLSLGTSGTVEVPGVIFWPILFVVLLFYILVLLGSIFLIAEKNYWQITVLVTPLISLLILSLIAFGSARFALPAFPALAVLSTVGISQLRIGK